MPHFNQHTSLFERSLHRRHRAERRFRLYGWGSLVCVMAVLCILLGGIIKDGVSGFTKFGVTFEANHPTLKRRRLAAEAYRVGVSAVAVAREDITQTLSETMLNELHHIPNSSDKRAIMNLFSLFSLRTSDAVLKQNPGSPHSQKWLWIPLGDKANETLKKGVQQSPRLINKKQLQWLDTMQHEGRLQKRFNWNFLLHADSREPEQAGILGAIVGSIYTVLITLAVAFPLGIGAAIYLEEFSTDNWITRMIDLNIRNLTAVPSVIFGLLGVGIFLNLFHLPRSSSLVAGMTLALIAMPVIILTARIALRSVPQSIRQAAQGLGASPVQVTFHHVLPLAMSGIMTGTILGLARTLSESAPLLMLGMVAFVANAPITPLDPATVLPVQIYTWARNPEAGFAESAAAAIVVLLGFLIIINLAAVIIRKRFEYRW